MTADQLLRDAADVVVTTQCGSAWKLQWRLGISPDAALGLLNDLEVHGIVGPDNGNEQRTVIARIGQVDELLGGVA